MRREDKNDYFNFKDKLIKTLPEPEKSVYAFFRETEEKNLHEFGKLIANGKTPVRITAEHFNLSEKEVKEICLSASLKLKNMARNE